MKRHVLISGLMVCTIILSSFSFLDLFNSKKENTSKNETQILIDKANQLYHQFSVASCEEEKASWSAYQDAKSELITYVKSFSKSSSSSVEVAMAAPMMNGIKCPEIQVIELTDVPGFSQTDLLMKCGEADTLSFLIFIEEPGSISGTQMSLAFDQGMEYAGFELTHYGDPTQISNVNPSTSNPKFLLEGITEGIFVAYIGTRINCEADITALDYQIDAQFNFIYEDTLGQFISCRQDTEIDKSYDDFIKEPDLAMIGRNLTLNTLGQQRCVQIDMVQGGLPPTYWDSLFFQVCNIDLTGILQFNEYRIWNNDTGWSGYMPASDFTYDATTQNLSLGIGSEFMGPDGRTTSNHQVSIQLCYQADSCPDIPSQNITYKASYGCAGSICKEARKDQVISVAPTARIKPIATAELSEIASVCGAPAEIDVSVFSGLDNAGATLVFPQDSALGLYTDVKFRFEACGASSMEITEVVFSEASLGQEHFEWNTDDIVVDLSANTVDIDGPGGIIDADGDGFFDDLAGGTGVDFTILLDFICPDSVDDPSELICNNLDCSFAQIIVEGKRDCGQAFKEEPAVGPFDILYGATYAAADSSLFHSATNRRIFMGTVGRNDNCNDRPVGRKTVEFKYVFESNDNVNGCANADNYMQILFDGSPLIVYDVQLNPADDITVSNDATGATTTIPSSSATWTDISQTSRMLRIPLGDATVGDTVRYKYTLEADTAQCAPWQYMTGTHQVFEDCNDCDCTILKACGSINFFSDPADCDCECEWRDSIVVLKRLNLGYSDKDRTMIADEADVAAAGDLDKFMAGDTMFIKTAHIPRTETVLRDAWYWHWEFGLFNGTLNGWDTRRLELDMDALNSELIGLYFKKQGSTTETFIDFSLLAQCQGGNNPDRGGLLLDFGTTAYDGLVTNMYQENVYNANSTFEPADNTRLRIRFYNPESREACANGAAKPGWMKSDPADCISELIDFYGIEPNDTIFSKIKFPLIKNPIRAADDYTQPLTNATQAWAWSDIQVLDENDADCVIGVLECRSPMPYSTTCPDSIFAKTEIEYTACGGSVEHMFIVQQPAPTGWFSREWRPYYELQDITIPIYSPLAFCGNLRGVLTDGTEFPLTVKAVDNHECVPFNGEEYCTVTSGNFGTITFNPYEDGYEGLAVGKTNLPGCIDTLRIRYDLCKICEVDINTAGYRLEYDYKFPYEPPFFDVYRCNQNNTTLAGIDIVACEDLTNWARYYQEYNLDTLVYKNDRFSEDAISTPPTTNFPTLTTEISPDCGVNVISSDAPGTSEEINCIRVCADTDGTETHMGVVTSFAISNSVQLVNVYDNSTPPNVLPTTLINSGSTTNTYAISLGELDPGECIDIQIGTTLLFCPEPPEMPDICITTTSGCLDPELLALLAPNTSPCNNSGICYNYLVGKTGIQGTFLNPSADSYPLCDTVPFAILIKNTNETDLTDIVVNMTIPNGMTLVTTSFEASYPNCGEDFDADGVVMGDFYSVAPPEINGNMLSYPEDEVWSTDIHTNGLPNLIDNLDNCNSYAVIRFRATTNCDEFVSGSRPNLEILAKDPCGPDPLQSQDIGEQIVIDGADPEDFAQILMTAKPAEAYCDSEVPEFTVTGQNISEVAAGDSVQICLTFPSNLSYHSGSAYYAIPAGLSTGTETITMIGDDTQVCFTGVDNLPVGGAFTLKFNADFDIDSDCGDYKIGVDIKDLVADLTCTPGPPDDCDVFVQTSVNPDFTVSLLAPMEIEELSLYKTCTDPLDPCVLKYSVLLVNHGPDYNTDIVLDLHDDILGDGVFDYYDPILATMSHPVTLQSGDTLLLEGTFTVDAINACPSLLNVTFASECVCNATNMAFSTIEPEWIADLPPTIFLCPGEELGVETCGDFEITYEPVDNMNERVVGDSIYLSPVDPSALTSIKVTGMVGECEYEVIKFMRGFVDFDMDLLVDEGCENQDLLLELNIPAEYREGTSVRWTPTTDLDDPNRFDPIFNGAAGNYCYTVDFTLSETCSKSEQVCFEIFANGFMLIDGDEDFCYGYAPGTLTASGGYDYYEWYRLDGGFEILQASTPTNSWNGPTEGGDYIVKGFNNDELCPAISGPFTIEAKECVDLELTKNIVNVPDPVSPGSTITYELEVCNINDSSIGMIYDATGVVISDQMPGAVTYVTHTQTSGNYSPNNNEWEISLIENGTCDTLWIDVIIDQVGTITNTAQITESDKEDIDSEENNDDGDQSEDDEDGEEIEVACESISGEIFYDNDGDGCQADDEGLVMEAINVSIFECGDVPGTDPAVAVTQTTDGMYEFGLDSDDPGADVCLDPGTEYFVVFDLPNSTNQALEDYTFSQMEATGACATDGNGDDVDGTTGQSDCHNPTDDDAGDGDADNNIDAGITPPCYSMSGEIFYDDNDNGCQDMGENLVDVAVNVSVYECGDVPGVDQPAATTTISDGMYEFGPDSDDPNADVCLKNDKEYFIVFDLPNADGEDLEGYTFSSMDPDPMCAVTGESDNVDPMTGASGCYDPDDDDDSDGDDDEDVDAGIVPPCESVGGEIFYDNNDNGCQDAGESLVTETVNVFIFECGDNPATDTPVASTVTNDGMYEFGPDSDDPGADVCLESGRPYFIYFDIPNDSGEALDGYEFSSMEGDKACAALGEDDNVDPATGESGCFDPNDSDPKGGDDDNHVDAGIIPPCHSLSGEIFYDGNDNGCQDAMEMLVMETIGVSLFECGDNPAVDPPVASTTVNDGMYEFSETSDDDGADVCLEAGKEYFVVFDIPNGPGQSLDGYSFSSMTTSGTCATDGNGDDVDASTGASGCYDPDNSDDGDGDGDEHVDGGIVPPCEQISGEIFYDNNNNGCQDDGEDLVMEDIEVSLYECGDTPGVDAPAASTTVNDGMYAFGETSDDAGANICLEAGTEYFVVFDIPSAVGQVLEDHTFSTATPDPACVADGDASDVDSMTGASDCVDPDNDEDDGDEDVDAGVVPPCETLSGEIFYDNNDNGCQDMGESLVDDASIEVSIYECGDTPGVDQPLASTTVSDGMYEFGEDSDDAGADICLMAGTEYFVVFDIPNDSREALEDYSFSNNDASGACATSGESDNVDPMTGASGCYDPNDDDDSDGDDDENVDAGITSPCYEVSGEIFYDNDNNGCEDTGESLVMEPINVSIFECGADPASDAPVASTTVTDGMYEFGADSDDPDADVCLENDKEYFVVFDIPNGEDEELEGYTFSSGTASAACENTGESSDVDSMSGTSDCVDPDNDDSTDGDDDENVDAGIVPPCESLAGEIFYDGNDNGCQDNMEALVMETIGVTLYECGDTPGVDPPVASTTVSDGMYEFGEDSDDPDADVCLEAGTEYFVVFDIPSDIGEALAGYEFSSQAASGACATDGNGDDVDPNTGASGCYDPDDDDSGDGEGDDSIDAGIVPPCEQISGEIFYDNNENGCQDPGESLVMEDIDVTLYECGDTPGVDAPVASTTVNDGMYAFGETSDDAGADVCLEAGTDYFVVFDFPSNDGAPLEDHTFTSGTADPACIADGESSDVDSVTGESDCVDPDNDDGDGDEDVDAGIVPPCESISGEIFYDENENGCQDMGEGLVMEDINVTLYECGETPGVDPPVAATTVSDGMYTFGEGSDDMGADVCLDAGAQYFVVFDIPNDVGEALQDYQFSTGTASPSCSTSGNSDDVNPSTGASSCVDPDNDDDDDGDSDNNVDAGITPPCYEMAGEIFYDDNGNGCEDADEDLVTGTVMVSLYECGSTPGVDAPVSITSVVDGMYEFGPDSDDPSADVCLEQDKQYFVVFDIPNGNGESLDGYMFSMGMADASCTQAGESMDVNPVTGASDCFDPDDNDDEDGDDDQNVDAGITPECQSLGGEIFVDTDGNGCQDSGEGLLMSDVNVTLYECGDDPAVDPPVATTTVSDGMYEFGEDSDDDGADVCLEAGKEYFVVFDIPNGPGEALEEHTFSMSTADPSCVIAGESDDVNPSTGASGCYDPSDMDDGDGDDDGDIDAGVVPPCESISGEIFYDNNANGCQDIGEDLVTEIIDIQLYECGDTPGVDAPVSSTTTNDGRYEFGEDSDDPGADVCLMPGTEYFVVFDIPNGSGEALDGYSFTDGMASASCEALGESSDVDPMTGTSSCYDPNDDDDGDGDSDENVDAGITPPCESISGEIFYDYNMNGCQDDSESLVMEEVAVTLYECGDTPGVDQPVSSTTVNNGEYEFGVDSDDPDADVCLEAGQEYFVVFDLPNDEGESLEGFSFTSGVATGACATSGDSDNVDPSTGASGCVDPDDDDDSDGDDDENVDAGITPPCENIAGEIFYDGNENGCQDGNESLVMEVINVTLYECGATPGVDMPVASTSVSDGMYEFGEDSDDPGAAVCLEAGKEYFVVFDVPMGDGEVLDGYEFTQGVASAGCMNAGMSSDVDPTTGMSDCVDPDEDDGDGDDDVDAGIKPPCEQIAGEIFYDDNNNGCQDDEEPLVDDQAIEVVLYQCGDVPGLDQPAAFTTVTDGQYVFGVDSDDPGADICLDAGDEYFVMFHIPNGPGEPLEDYYFSENIASPSCLFSGEGDNIDPNTGMSGCHDPSNDDDEDGDADENIDAGIMHPCEILAGEIYYDNNNDGCQDADEGLVMEAINVTLYQCGDDPASATPVASTTTTDGTYQFGDQYSLDYTDDPCLNPRFEYFVAFDFDNGAGDALEDYYYSDGDSASCPMGGNADDTDRYTGETSCYGPDNDDDDMHIDMGITPCEEISGEVFVDWNADGCQGGPMEGPASGVNVYIFSCNESNPNPDNAIASDITDDNGEYAFGPEEEGTAEACLHPDSSYYVTFQVPNATGEQHDDFYLTHGDGASCAGGEDADDVSQGDGRSDCLDPDDDDDDDDVDAGITPCEEMGGEVFFDMNGDGCQDSMTDGPVTGVTAYIYSCNEANPTPENALASDVTDANGEYDFGPEEEGDANVCLHPDSSYYVVYDLPNNDGEALDNYGLTEGDGSTCTGGDNGNDADPITDRSECYDPDDDDDDSHVNTGLIPCEEISGEVFYDDNADGCQEEGEEEGVEGMNVYVFECGTTDLSPGNAVASDVTDENGEYKFGPAEEGSAKVCLDADKEYFVLFDLPNGDNEAFEGFEFTDGDGATCAGAENADDVDPLTGTSSCVDPEGDDDDNDIDAGIKRPVDIALRKVTMTEGPYQYGQEVIFGIEIINQGSLDLYNVKVNDFVSCGFKYLSSNDGTWSYDPFSEVATTTYAGPLEGQSSDTIFITMELVPCSDDDAYTNTAEVESMEDEDGEDVTDDDVDSTGDDDPTNDGDMDDDNVDGDGQNGEDEDDSDFEDLEIFDLALIKELITPPMFEEGDTIEFRHTIVNQGNVTAANIQIVDYLPSGYTFVPSLNSGWSSATAPTYSYNVSGTLTPGATAYVSIFVTVNYVAQLQENYTNYGEISDATDEDGNERTDADSTPDNNPDNDGTPVDDALNDRGDEDDHDPAGIDLLEEFIPPCSVSCDLPCRDQINLSLGMDCTGAVTPAMVLVGLDPGCNTATGLLEITLKDEHGNELPDSIVGIEYLGQNLTYEFTNLDPNCNNTCWGNVLVEYKFLPQIDCPGIDTLSCGALDILGLPRATGSGCMDIPYTIRLVDEVREQLDCDSLVTQKVTRTYRAEDDFGNFSECEHEIYVRRVDLSGLMFPDNATLSCADTRFSFYENNGCSIPIPWILTGSGSSCPASGHGYGVPVVCDQNDPSGLVCPLTGSGSAVPLIPLTGASTIDTTCNIQVIEGTTQAICNTMVSYTDVVLPGTPCHKKVMRTWEVREWWCSGEFTMGSVQMIEIKDDQAPDIVCPADMTVTTDDDCAGSIDLPAITAQDNCGDNGIIVSVDYPTGFLYSNGGAAELEVGSNQIKYIVSDSCYNDTMCVMNVMVRDLTEPVAICEQHTVVSLTTTDYSYILAESLDDGSWDECGLDRFEVRRMDTTCVSTDIEFSDKVAFCCSDAGSEVMVIFRAYDKGGNYNDCMVTVEVQDKQVPLLSCPENDTIDCRVAYDINNLSLTFGGPDINDNCPTHANIEEDIVSDVNQCGIGQIIRTLRVLGDDDQTVLRKCTQLITIINEAPFVASNIQWPLDYETNGACLLSDLDPEDLSEISSVYGFPIFTSGDDQCSLLGWDYEDKVYTSNQGSGECAHIERYWTVIDWCGVDSDGNFARYSQGRPQVIKLTNNVSPQIVAQGPVEIVSGNVDCESGLIEFTREATDDCMNALNWRYTIRSTAGVVVGSGNSATLLDTLVAGDYTVEWVVEDLCGNFDSDNQVIRVINNKAPSPVCLNGLSASLTGEDTDGDGAIDTETFELWAVDIDGGSFHTCDNDIVLSFSSDTTDRVRLYDCSNIGIQTVELWVTDVVTGVQDFCSTFIDIQDEGLCPDANMVSVIGEVYTERLEMVGDVEVKLGDTGIEDMTDDAGSYAFENMPMGGSYEIVPKKDVDYLNGVSTLDLIYIQKHILGIDLLDSGYQMIAADANSSEDITALDLIELRKLILGVYDDLPENESWRFVDKAHDFVQENNPWVQDVPETYNILGLDQDMDIDFIGVKVGDVNGSVTLNATDSKIEKRSASRLLLNVKEVEIKDGLYAAEIRSSGYTDINGWQGTLEFDSNIMEIVGLSGQALPIEESHYNTNSQSEAWMAISYHEKTGKSRTVKSGDVLLEILYRKSSNAAETSVQDLFKLSSLKASKEAYNANNEVMDVELRGAKEDGIEIVNVSPNPWIDQTTIEFYIPESGEGRWEFYDVNGRTLHTMKNSYTAGYHSMEVKRVDIQASGIVYVKLITDSSTTEYKMMLIN